MKKPSLHELITQAIKDYEHEPAMYEEELAEKIIKIIRDYHLTE